MNGATEDALSPTCDAKLFRCHQYRERKLYELFILVDVVQSATDVVGDYG